MKQIFQLILLLGSLSTTRAANLPNEAEMKFAKNAQGKTMFSCDWFSIPQIAVCNLGLEWNNFDPLIHERGIMLSKAEEKRMLSPKLPGDCALTSFNGSLPPEADRVFPFSFNLKGGGCESFIERLRTELISFDFINAPVVVGSDIFPVATMKILEPPSD